VIAERKTIVRLIGGVVLILLLLLMMMMLLVMTTSCDDDGGDDDDAVQDWRRRHCQLFLFVTTVTRCVDTVPCEVVMSLMMMMTQLVTTRLMPLSSLAPVMRVCLGFSLEWV
jgi:hypothetical protein